MSDAAMDVCIFMGVGLEPVDNAVYPYSFDRSITDVAFDSNGEYLISDELLKGSELRIINFDYAVDLDNLPDNVEVIDSYDGGCVLLIKGDCTIPLILASNSTILA